MNYILYRWKLRKLQQTRNKITHNLKNDIKNAQNSKNSKVEIAEIKSLAWFETDCIDEDIDELNTRYWTDKSRKYCLPNPSGKDNWKEGPNHGRRVLTREAILELRTLVRKEREIYLIWLAALTDILGTLTGLIAIIKS